MAFNLEKIIPGFFKRTLFVASVTNIHINRYAPLTADVICGQPLVHMKYICTAQFVKVRSGPPHDGTIITEKNATMVTSS